MTVAEAWQAGREHLAALGIDEAGITAEVLLRHALSLDRTALYMAWSRPIDPEGWARCQALLAERGRGRPVAYIVGHREFMGLQFQVDERVLIPRPETEVLVAAVLKALERTAAPVVADIGTGSGAIAVSLAVLRPDARVVATDISSAALEVARANAARHDVTARVRFFEGDLLQPLIAAGLHLDAVACNPPYVAPAAAGGLPPDIRDFEPSVAVVAPGGAESLHARLVESAPRVLKPGGWLVMEVSAGQAPRVVELLHRTAGYEVAQTRRDGLGWERVVAARRAGHEGDRVSYYHLSFETALDREPKPVSIIRVDPDELTAPRKAVEVLHAGGLVAFPTEDGYVVGCSALDPAAIRRLCEATGAAADSLLAFVAAREQADRVSRPARIPRHPVALALVRDVGAPVLATACTPGARPVPTAQQVVFVLGDKVDLVLNAGPISRQPVGATGGAR